jgi:amino acid transporter
MEESTATAEPTGGGSPPAAGRPPKPAGGLISWSALALMTVSSVASLRPAPTMAVYGLACVFLYALPAIVFLIPTALVSAELASGWDGGVYRWVTEGMSPNMGFAAAWHQFAMTIFYYPTLLSFVASTLAYVIAPDLASNGVFTAIVIIVVYWAGVLLSLRGGIGIIAKLASSGVLVGTLVPGALLVVLGIVYLLQGNPSAAPMTASHLLPEWTGIASIVLIVSNFGAYSGMEMNAVHVNELDDPPKQFPKAMFVAVGLVLVILILPPLAISWVVPSADISLTAGVMQAFQTVLAHFGLDFLTPLIGLAIVAATLAGFMTWLSGPSKSLLLVAKNGGYLPPYLQKTNQVGVQQNILVVQGFVTTLLALLFALVPAVSNAYWIFMTITTSVYLLVYLWLFISAYKLRKTQPDHPRGYRAPALPLLCVVGFVSSLAAIGISFVPPSQFGDGSPWAFVAIVGGGLLLLGLIIPFALVKLRKPSWKVDDGPAAPATATGGAS